MLLFAKSLLGLPSMLSFKNIVLDNKDVLISQKAYLFWLKNRFCFKNLSVKIWTFKTGFHHALEKILRQI